MLRWPNKPAQMVSEPLTIEQIIREYQLYHSLGNTISEDFYVSYLTENAKQILRCHGYKWDSYALDFLKSTLAEFDTYSGREFWDFFVYRLNNRGNCARDTEAEHMETIRAAGYKGNGFMSFTYRDNTSTPEAIAVGYLNKTIKPNADIDPDDELDTGESDAELSAMIDEILFG